MKLRRKLSVVLVLAVLWFISLLLMPIDTDVKMYVPPSELFLHQTFSCKYWYYKHRPSPDLLILGNSRTDAALDPDIISAELQRKCDRSVNVASLSSGGGYFPFYREILTTLIDRKQLPGGVIMGVSPRDFNKHEDRRYTVAEFLKTSSGYNLKRVPYSEPFHTIEAKLADISALLFPGFFYSDGLGKQLFRSRESVPDIRAFSNYPRIQALMNKWYKDAVVMVPRLQSCGPGMKLESRIKYYFSRFWMVKGWNPTRMGMIGPTGRNIAKTDYSVFSERNREALAKQRALFSQDQTGSPYLNYRYEKNFRSQADIWNDPSGAPEQTFKFLFEHNIKVYIVIPPAYVLEGWENNIYFNDLLKGYLLDLQKRYPNIRQVIDINNNFDHAFLNPELYYDAEHATPEASLFFSKYLVGLMDFQGNL